MDTALGFRPHSGWTAAVAVGSVDGRPVALERRRVDLSAPGVPVQPYHAAAGRSLDAASAVVRQAYEVALAGAMVGLDELLAALGSAGHGVVAVGLPVGSLAIPSELAAILGSHPLLHAAEGDLYRQAVAQSAEERGLRVVETPARELGARAGRALGLDEPGLRAALIQAGQLLGRPWRKDEKDATMLAWLALASSGSGR